MFALTNRIFALQIIYVIYAGEGGGGKHSPNGSWGLWMSERVAKLEVVGVEHDGDGAVVAQVNLHVGSEDAAGDGEVICGE